MLELYEAIKPEEPTRNNWTLVSTRPVV